MKYFRFNFAITHGVLRCVFMMMALTFLSGCENQSGKTAIQSIGADQNKIETAQAQKKVLLALGDSLTEGLGVARDQNYPAILQKKLNDTGYSGYHVINAGLSGETSSGLKNRLNWVLKSKPEITILTIGANDAMRGLPLSLTKQNIEDIIETLKASGSEVILGGMQIYDNLGKNYVQEFKKMYEDLAVKHGLVMIPFFLQGVAGIRELNNSDMIHPNALGYVHIVDNNIFPVLRPFLSKPE